MTSLQKVWLALGLTLGMASACADGTAPPGPSDAGRSGRIAPAAIITPCDDPFGCSTPAPPPPSTLPPCSTLWSASTAYSVVSDAEALSVAVTGPAWVRNCAGPSRWTAHVAGSHGPLLYYWFIRTCWTNLACDQPPQGPYVTSTPDFEFTPTANSAQLWVGVQVGTPGQPTALSGASPFRYTKGPAFAWPSVETTWHCGAVDETFDKTNESIVWIDGAFRPYRRGYCFNDKKEPPRIGDRGPRPSGGSGSACEGCTLMSRQGPIVTERAAAKPRLRGI